MMNKSRIEYENLIRNSILFSLNRETQAIAYKREALKMVEYLYLYLTSINEDKYSEYGLEITQTAHRCIKNYTSESGDFLNYFNAAMAKEYRKAYAIKHQAEQHGGVHIPEQDQRIIRKILKMAEAQGTYDFDDNFICKISEVTGINEKQVKEYIVSYQNSFVVNDTYTNDDGEEGSLFDYIPATDGADNELLEIESATELLEKIDIIFSKRQERQKPLLSKLLTAKIVKQLIDYPELFVVAKKTAFFNNEIYEQTLKHGNPPTAKEIGKSLGLSEQSVSRSYKVFVSLL